MVQPDLTHERWRSVVDYEGLYEISDQGRVKSLRDRHGPRTRILSPRRIGNRKQKRQIALWRDGKQKAFYVSRLVLGAFVGPCPEGLEACHFDDEQSDNRLENLRWDTHEANLADGRRNGRIRRGETHGRAIFTDDQVREIKRLLRNRVMGQTIAAQFGVAPSRISDINTGKFWSHITI